MEREIDWRAYVNKLIFCYGCGRFRMPKNGVLPQGWSTLYQPHGDAPAGLTVCSDGCKTRVREAMMMGPVTEPLASVCDIPMSTEMRESMMREVAGEQVDDAFETEVGEVEQ